MAFAAAGWRGRWWHIVGRASFTGVALAAVASAVWLYQWNLLVFGRSLL
jgi:hypothetical protein